MQYEHEQVLSGANDLNAYLNDLNDLFNKICNMVVFRDIIDICCTTTYERCSDNHYKGRKEGSVTVISDSCRRSA